MARRKNQPESVRTKCSLAERLRAIRAELYGDRGGPELARRLELPIRTWYNYEAGVTVPAEVMLRFVELTSAEPLWLLRGQGPKFRSGSSQADSTSLANNSVEDLLRKALQRLEQKAPNPSTPEPGTAESRNGPPGLSGLRHSAEPQAPDREWLVARREGRCVRVEGNAMAPIVADGADVAFADADEELESLEGKLVVAWVDGRPLVRWFQLSGRFAILRAENPGPDSGTELLDIAAPAGSRRIRRVLWIGTRH